MPFGILDTSYIDLPTSVDESYIRGMTSRAGVAFDELLLEIDNRLGAFNDGLDPLMYDLLYATSDMFTEEIFPVPFDVQEKGEYTVPRPQYMEAQGKSYMLPIRSYDLSVGWTEDGLKSMSMSRILVNLESVILGMQTNRRRQFLRRLFSDAEISVDKKSTATNPGFAGSGVGANAFTRPFPDGTAIPTGYTLYLREVPANRLAAVRTQRDKLRKWHPDMDIELVGTEQFVADFVAQARAQNTAVSSPWVETGSTLVRPAPNQAEALVDPQVYLGVLDGNLRVRRPLNWFSGDYGLVFVSFGAGDPRNALAWRYDNLYGRDAFIRSREMYPLAQAIMIQKYGFGVANRVAAAPIQIDPAAGVYTPPVIV